MFLYLRLIKSRKLLSQLLWRIFLYCNKIRSKIDPARRIYDALTSRLAAFTTHLSTFTVFIFFLRYTFLIDKRNVADDGK